MKNLARVFSLHLTLFSLAESMGGQIVAPGASKRGDWLLSTVKEVSLQHITHKIHYEMHCFAHEATTLSRF